MLPMPASPPSPPLRCGSMPPSSSVMSPSAPSKVLPRFPHPQTRRTPAKNKAVRRIESSARRNSTRGSEPALQGNDLQIFLTYRVEDLRERSDRRGLAVATLGGVVEKDDRAVFQ